MPSLLRLHLLSSLAASAETSDGTRHLARGKPVALLAFLSGAPGRRASRERLGTLLWSEGSSEQARQNLRQTIWYVRRRLGAWLTATDDFVELVSEVETDRDLFLLAVREGRLRDAITVYAGEFIPDFAAPGAAEFEQWIDVERRRLRAIFIGCCDTLARQSLSAGQPATAVEIARRARDAAPLEFGTWRLLLESLIAARDPVSCLAEAEHLEAVLSSNELEADDATRAMIRSARAAATGANGIRDHADGELGTPIGRDTEGAGDAASIGATAGALAHDDGRSFAPELIGRESEFRALLDRWEQTKQDGGGALLVSGVAGLGKSRLLADLHARLRASRAKALLIRANPGDRAVLGGFIAAVAEAVAQRPGAMAISAESAAVLVALSPALSSAFSHARPDAAIGEDALRRRVGALLDLLRAVSEESALALLIDDVHWIDAESLRVLDAVSARLDRGRALIILAARPPLDALGGFAALTRVELPRFDIARTAEFVTRLGELPAEAWAAEFPAHLLAATRGVPLNVIEALQGLVESGALSLHEGRWVAAAPARIADVLGEGMVLEARVRSLAPGAREILVLLATLGRPTDAAIGAGAIVELEHRGFVSRFEGILQVAHDEIAAAALASATDEERRVAHVRSAALVAAEPESERSLRIAASHALIAGDHGQLRDLTRRFVRRRRQEGGAESVARLVAALVGADVEAGMLARLERAFPWHERPSRMVRRFTTIALVLGLVLGGWNVFYRAPRPDLELLVRTDGPDRRWLRFVIADAERWSGGDPIAGTLVADAALPFTLGENERVFLSSLPDGSGWIGNGFFADSGGDEVVFLPRSGPLVRPAHYRGDDGGASASPDGRFVAFATARYHPATDRSNIAVLDRRTGKIRRLVESNESDTAPFWSPDGTRVAFTRNFFSVARYPTICIASVDGVEVRCDWESLGNHVSAVGWLDPAHVLFVDPIGDLSSLDVGSGAITPLLGLAGGAQMLSDGRTLVTIIEGTDSTSRGLALRRVDRALAPRALTWRGRPVSGSVIMFSGNRPSARYVDRVRLEIPSAGIAVDAPFTLRAAGVTAAESEVAAYALRVRSLDESVAVVRGGVLRARRLGPVRLEVTLGGWRSDTVEALVVPSNADEVVAERWSTDWSSRWRPFGDPMPRLGVGDGGPTMITNGDGKFSSGVYLMRELDGSRGLGIEIRFSAPLTEMQWQQLDVGIEAGTSFRRFDSWDHRSGNLEAPNGRACSTGLGGEGGTGRLELQLRSSSLVAQRTSTPSGLYDGSWHTLRMQLFADGRCGLAIDGVPLLVTEHPAPDRSPYLVTLQGHTVGTTIQIGRVAVWTGVRGGIDWESSRP